MKTDFFEDFEAVSKEQWTEQLKKDLKGEDPHQKLIWNNIDGIDVAAWLHPKDGKKYPDNPGSVPYRRGTKHQNNHWNIQEVFEVLDDYSSRDLMLEALNGGTNHLVITLNGEHDFEVLFKDIQLEIIHCDVWVKNTLQEEQLLKYLRKNYDINALHFNILRDPISENLKIGKNCTDEEWSDLQDSVHRNLSLSFMGNIDVQGNTIGQTGGNAVQELAYSLSVAQEYLNRLEDVGNIDELSKAFRITLSVGNDLFMEMAKFRAMRLLWSTLISAYEPKADCSQSLRINGKVNTFYYTANDRYNNILRATTATFAAASGGADAILVPSFDVNNKDAESFSRRISRNIQHILQQESYLNLVADPLGGSYLVENLTDELVQKAWSQFLDIESRGGIQEALESGYFQEDVINIRTARIDALNNGSMTLLGVNKYQPEDFELESPEKFEDEGEIIGLPSLRWSTYYKNEKV